MARLTQLVTGVCVLLGTGLAKPHHVRTAVKSEESPVESAVASYATPLSSKSHSKVQILSQVNKCTVTSTCQKFIRNSHTIDAGAEDGFISDMVDACGECEFIAKVEQTYDSSSTTPCDFKFGAYLSPFKFPKSKVMSKFYGYVEDVTCPSNTKPTLYMGKKAGGSACGGSTDFSDFAYSSYDSSSKLVTMMTKDIWDFRDIAVDLNGCSGSFKTTATFNLRLSGVAQNLTLGAASIAALLLAAGNLFA